MSIFRKAISQIGPEDFKSEVPAKDETLKKLSSLANTFGGWVVIGAQDSGADAWIVALPGVDLRPGYKQKVVTWYFDAVRAPRYRARRLIAKLLK